MKLLIKDEELNKIAEEEKLNPEELIRLHSQGRVVFLKNSKRKKHIKPLAVGERTSTKVNANIGTSPDRVDLEMEILKLSTAVNAGADTVMDLSTGGDVWEILNAIIDLSPVPVGTVPIYQAAVDARMHQKPFTDLTASEIIRVIERQAEIGVDFMTIHAGVTKKSLEFLKRKPRVLGVVSRGGTLMMEWMGYNRKENPLYENFETILEIAKEYNITLSLGDGLRPGCIEDSTDQAQIEELNILGELTLRAWDEGVQVIIEGPGHVPINEVEENVKLQKKLCHGAPFYVLGPIVTDIAPGYDHITGAIGGAIAASAGADFLCYITPAEHLKLPDVDEVREGVIATKIAAHVGDIAKGIPGARERDKMMAKARKLLDWERQFELSLDPEKAKRLRNSSLPSIEEVCTMCGEFCSIRKGNILSY